MGLLPCYIFVTMQSKLENLTDFLAVASGQMNL